MEKKFKKPLTRHGHGRIVEEWNQLFHKERPKIVEAISVAASEGDRSENAEYIYGKKKLRELDKRIRYLDSLLKDAQVIDIEKVPTSQVGFGVTVIVLDEDDEEKTWTLVGEGETEYSPMGISWKAPVAKALFGKKVGDTVTAYRPIGPMDYTILRIEIRKNGL